MSSKQLLSLFSNSVFIKRAGTLLRCFPRKGEQTGFGFFSALSIFYEWVGRVGGGGGRKERGRGGWLPPPPPSSKIMSFWKWSQPWTGGFTSLIFFTVMNFLFWPISSRVTQTINYHFSDGKFQMWISAEAGLTFFLVGTIFASLFEIFLLQKLE